MRTSRRSVKQQLTYDDKDWWGRRAHDFILHHIIDSSDDTKHQLASMNPRRGARLKLGCGCIVIVESRVNKRSRESLPREQWKWAIKPIDGYDRCDEHHNWTSDMIVTVDGKVTAEYFADFKSLVEDMARGRD